MGPQLAQLFCPETEGYSRVAQVAATKRRMFGYLDAAPAALGIHSFVFSIDSYKNISLFVWGLKLFGRHICFC